VLVIDDDVLVGIVTQGDCAIKVLLPGLDAKQTPVGQVMTDKGIKPQFPNGIVSHRRPALELT
jgi:CBS domain-containing protein